jgi:hypothetical protein
MRRVLNALSYPIWNVDIKYQIGGDFKHMPREGMKEKNKAQCNFKDGFNFIDNSIVLNFFHLTIFSPNRT